MTKTLILTRHAKSDWSSAGLGDHDRPLNARGYAAAPVIGRWVAQQAHPDEALVSTARRARETWDGMAPALVPAPKVSLLPHLYHAAPETLMDALHGATGDTVLMIAHNPGIADFAERILTKVPDDDAFLRYPTCATLIACFDIDHWAEAAFGTARALNFVVPRRLEASL